MPTGYTAKLCEGEQSFAEFCLTCARAFGALVSMRDDDMDAPIPEAFAPSDYYGKELAKNRANLSHLRAMAETEALAHGAGLRDAQIKMYQDIIAEEKIKNDRLLAMKAQVEAWTPPSPDHTGLKDFMLQKLEVTYNDPNYYYARLEQAKAASPKEYFWQAVRETEQAINRGIVSVREEQERADGRTRWVKQLRESLT